MTPEQMDELENEAKSQAGGTPLAKHVVDLIHDHRELQSLAGVSTSQPQQSPIEWALGGLRRALEEAPEATVAVGAFVTALVCPRHEKLCERIIVAALDAHVTRMKNLEELERMDLERR